MASNPIFDVETFLQPISAESATGKDLRDDYSPQSPYFEIKDAQTAARSDERRRRESFDETLDTDFRIDDWKPVLVSAQQIFLQRSKDLEIAAWHIEALLRIHGFAGIRDGFRLLRELTDRFWDGIHPRPDDDGLATTVAAITSLNGEDGPGTLIWPISNIPIVAQKKWGTWQCRQAQSLENADPKVAQKRVAEGAITPEMFRAAVKETPPEFFRNLMSDIEQALAEVSACGAVFREKCAANESGYEIAPGTLNIEQALKDAMSAIRSVTSGIDLATPVPLEETVAEAGDAAVASPAAGPSPAHDRAMPTGVSAVVQSRDQAYRAVQELAEYFRKTEPHSPTAYLLDQAVRWGRMPLPKLLEELLSDKSIKQDLFRLMGMERGNE